MVRNCQVCGNPMFSKNDLGSNDDGSFNKDFCSNCYRGGEFTGNKNQGSSHFTSLMYPFTAVNGLGTGSMTGASTPGYFPPIIRKDDDMGIDQL